MGCLASGWYLGIFVYPSMDLDAAGARGGEECYTARNYLPVLPSQELNYFSQLNFCD